MSTFFQKFHNARESLAPTLKTSAFLAKGVLTPAEFLAAGDELVFKCPTWEWHAGDPASTRPHLPANKQYLITRNVPCASRCSAIEAANAHLDGLVGVEGGEWMIERSGDEDDHIEDEFDLIEDEDVKPKADTTAPAPAPAAPAPSPVAAAADDEYADMADFEDDSLATDTAALSLAPASAQNVTKTRTYDLSITYDKYYQTPRVWLQGYDESLAALTGDEMFQDVMSDYVKRTVTIEKHPHHPLALNISIHPCQHGAVMKNIVENMTKGDGTVAVEKYMFIFLKFVSSIIPTINYDFTMEVSGAST